MSPFLFITLLFFWCVRAAPPNFIVIVADDLGYNDVTAFGSPTIRTPNLDQMAREGLKLTQFYSAAPLCTPSRGAMLTGRLPIRSGLFTYFDYPVDLLFRVFYPSSVGCLPPSERTLPEYLKASQYNYSNVMIGKWHLGHNSHIGCLPVDRGFDYFYGLPYSHEEGYPGPAPEDLIWPPLPLLNGRTIVQQPPDLDTLTSRYTERALNWLDTFASTKQPFFMHLAYEQPHVPLFASPEFVNTSKRGLYGDAVQEMDDSIGQVLNKLRSNGLASNTLVFFTSDNGAWVNPSDGVPTTPTKPLTGGCNAPFYDGKGSTWEGGVREPGIFWWPGVIQPGVSMEVINMLDLLPTFLEFAGVPLPPVELDGMSMTSLLLGKNTTSPRVYTYYWREHVLYALRYGPWKAHYYTRSGFENDPPVYHDPPLLFNVEYDPGELFPFNTTTEPDVMAAITAAYNAHLAEVEPGISQYEAQDWTLVPCCGGPFNSTAMLEYIREHEWTLALWEELGCVCPDEIPNN